MLSLLCWCPRYSGVVIKFAELCRSSERPVELQFLLNNNTSLLFYWVNDIFYYILARVAM